MSRSKNEMADAGGAVSLPGDRDAWTLAASIASDGLWYYDVTRGEATLSPRARELLGYHDEEAPSGIAAVRRHVDGADMPMLQRIALELIGGERTRADMELRLLTLGGASRWTHVRLRARRGTDGTTSMIVGSLTDIDQRKRLELQLRDEARRDHLTGLPNRLALMEWLTARVAKAAVAPGPRFALLYIDLDRFKVINDSLGHAAGDEVLLAAVDRMAAVLGADDMLARVGGDEFVALLDSVENNDDALRMAERIHGSLRKCVVACGHEVYTPLSIGVRTSTDVIARPTDMLRDADLSMYEAKRSGGARTVVFDLRLHHAMVERLRMQTELRHAIERDELRAAYQPIFDVSDCRLCGFEAFVRWQHPSRGKLPASEFVNSANESGLIVHLGRWMLNEVCEQLADWRRELPNALPLSIAVNLCDREIADPEFASSVLAALRSHAVPASSLVLEMTEGVLRAGGPSATAALQRLRDEGVQVQLANFGRGYSSLTMLRRMPLTAIKIDRSLIVDLACDVEAQAMVATISAFARTLKLDLAAEGVETREQADALASLGNFRYAQGHHFGMPVGEEVARDLMA